MIRESLINFFNNWQQDKENAINILSTNKKYNSDLKTGEISEKSHQKTKKTYSLYNLKSATILRKKIFLNYFMKKLGFHKVNTKLKDQLDREILLKYHGFVFLI